jgi:hypothetical protein
MRMAPFEESGCVDPTVLLVIWYGVLDSFGVSAVSRTRTGAISTYRHH